MGRNKIIELLKTGNFTVIYWDNCVPSLYKGKYKIEDFEGKNPKEVDFKNYDNGYCPEIVSLLVEALNGKSDSI